MILVTGGTGYIGSHSVVELCNNGYEVLIADNFSNSKPIVLENLKKITNANINFIEVDICDFEKLYSLTKEYNITGVIHLAALKAVAESVESPIEYYQNNIVSLLNILKLCDKREIKNFVFSSSATVYGIPEKVPVLEKSPIGKIESPYGKTKYFCEEILKDFQNSKDISICNLRYFNPIGAHKSSLIGDYPNGTPNNLLPYLTQVAIGIRNELKVFGNDYETKDGSCIRDFIHVVDLASAHLKAFEYNKNQKKSFKTFNIGTGNGISVLELIKTFEKVNSLKLNYRITKRRKGDIDVLFADCSYSEKELNWKAKFSIEEMLSSAWNFQQKMVK